MNNTKVKEIIKFSLYKNIQNKWFILFNSLTLISLIVLLNWGTITNFFNIKEELHEVFKKFLFKQDINIDECPDVYLLENEE